MKRLIFGLLVAAVALGGSAFTNVDHIQHIKGGKSITANFLNQTATSVYTQRSGGGTCGVATTLPCSYTVQFPNDIPEKDEYTPDDIASYVAQGWLVQTSAFTRIYVGS